MSKVAIVRGTNPQDITVAALEMTSAHKVLSKANPVLIKPNFISARHPSTGITTDSRVIEGVVKFLKQHHMEDMQPETNRVTRRAYRESKKEV